MTDNTALAQELEACPNPWCNSHRSTDPEIRAAEAPILMPSKASDKWCVACPVCPLQSPWQNAEADAVAAWNIRYHKPAQPQQPSEDMVERVARAISEHTWATGPDDNSDCFTYVDMPEHTRDVYRRAALAAIAAIQGGAT